MGTSCLRRGAFKALSALFLFSSQARATRRLLYFCRGISKVMKHLTGFLWLLTLLSLNRGDVEQHLTCSLSQQTFPVDSDTLNIGQKWGKNEPTAVAELSIKQLISSSSHFEIRTLDPEGAIFHANVRNNTEWFLLGLRNGRPEVQIQNSLCEITVCGGDALNDGQWHNLKVSNERNLVLLEADGKMMFTIGGATEPINEIQNPKMTIAVGGIQTNHSNLLMPMNTALDACFRRWKWLNQTSSWIHPPGVKPCFSSIQKGSFFSGAGIATFRTSEGIMPRDDWAVTLEMGIHMDKRRGILLAFSVEDHMLLLVLRVNEQGFSLEFGSNTSLELPLPPKTCLGFSLLLTISPTHLIWKLGDEKIEHPVQQVDYQELRTAWHKKGGQISFGGLPNMEKMSPEESDVFFEGCLSEIQLQGRTLDMDSALYKSDTVWSHSCPQFPLNS
uniref:Sex hormone-binding globulin n=1 Tax=Geotrypetes seraphini TaxID=260995 RepID=A0A6P8PIN8_GEOSA|nr:sex hormone-binding globulin [Geotrypetes seraphini]